MAEIDTIDKVIARIRRLPEAVADHAVDVMKEKINTLSKNPTGELASTVRKGKYADGSYYVETHKYTKGPYGIREVGAIISKGRPELWPRYKKALAFPPPPGWDGPVSKKGLVVIGHAQAADPNPFLERTKEEVLKDIESIWNSL